MHRAIFRRGIAVALMLIAGWQFGQAIYIQSKALLAQYLLQHAWSETGSDSDRARPWPWADTWPVARLRVARLDVDQIVLAGTSGRTLAFGPGHLPGSALPGSEGNAVLSGHRDTHFQFLRALENGDEILLTAPDRRQVIYTVYRAGVYHQSDISPLLDDRENLTLITCYPFDAIRPGGPLRFVVSARPNSKLS